MMLVLMLLPLLLQAQMPAAQKIRLYVQDRCVDNPGLNGTGGNFFFVAGCTARLLCKYTSADYCLERNTTDLTVIPRKNHNSLINSSMVVVEKTKCHVLIDIRNITTEHSGPYTCMDRDYEGANMDRNIEVGEVPMVPQNMTVVYEPGGNITLLLDPVKQGFELGDTDTKWNVAYDWLETGQTCSKQTDSKCQDLDPGGMCHACFIKVRSQRCGQVAGQGNVFNTIHFNITVHNKFGQQVLDHNHIYLPDFVKPAPVREIRIRRIGTDRINVRVDSPNDFDQCHMDEIKTDENKLSYNYTIDLVSLRAQGLEEGKHFFETYGFVRNLEDDEAALSASVRSAFPRYSESYLWTSDRPTSSRRLEPQPIRIQDLPFAGYMYTISVQTKAHYWGGVLWLKAKTEESAPKEGPQLHENFANCQLINESCAVCLIYFKEIPRPARGGKVLNHTLLLTSLNTDAAVESKCSIGTEAVETTGGQNNTFRVFGVPVGGVYNVSLWAQQSKAVSPITNAVLHVRSTPPPFAAQDIVLESSGASHDISWKPGSVVDNVTMRYFLHHCSAIPLQLYNVGENGNKSSLPTVPLNCVINMASLEVSKNSTNSHTFDNPHQGLTPAFFVSTLTSTGLTSGLLPVDCFYAKSRVPDQVTSLEVQKVDGDPGNVDVTFRLPCGQDLNYNFGRPDSYAIGFAKDDGSLDCMKMMTGLDLNPPMRIQTRLKDPVVYRKTGLEEATNYCACVHLFARNDAPRDMWTCKRFTTGTEPDSALSVWLILIVVVAAIVMIVVVFYVTWKTYRCYANDREKFGTIAEKEEMVPSPPLKNKLQNGGHMNPKMFMRLDSGVDSTPASPVVIDMLEDTFVYPGGDSDDRRSEENENEDNESVRENALSGYHSQLSSSSGSAEDSAPNSLVLTAGRTTSRYAGAGTCDFVQLYEGEDEEGEEEEEDDTEEQEDKDNSCTAFETSFEGEEEENSGDKEEELQEEEEEELDPDVDRDGVEADQLDSKAEKADLPQVMLAFLQGMPSSHKVSLLSDVPEQADLEVSSQKPSVEEIVQAFENAQAASTVPPSVALLAAGSSAETGDRNPLSDVGRTQAVSADSSTLHCPESQVDSVGDVRTDKILETLAATESGVESGSRVHEDTHFLGERKEQRLIEDSPAAADSSKGAENERPAADTQRTFNTAGAEGMGAESASHGDTEMLESETDLASEKKPEAAAVSSLLSQHSQLSEQSTSSVDDIMKAAEGCAWISAGLAGHPDPADQVSPDVNDDPSGSESNRNSICGPESGFESESAKETDSETDKSSTENLFPVKRREQPPLAATQQDQESSSVALAQDTTVLKSLDLPEVSLKPSSVSVDADQASPKQTGGVSGHSQKDLIPSNLTCELSQLKRMEDVTSNGRVEVPTEHKTRPTSGLEHSTSHHPSGPTVSSKAPLRSKHSANHAVKHESSDHAPLLDKINKTESSDSDSTEFVSENKAFSMEENGDNKQQQRRKDGSRKYCKVTREVDPHK